MQPQEKQLRQDWQELCDRIALGEIDKLSAAQGKYLQIRPKAANAAALTRDKNQTGAASATLPRGFYLRPIIYRRHHCAALRRGPMPDRRVSIAPMLAYTDRHFRYFMRLLSKHTVLYTEMITTGALLRGERQRLLEYNEIEHPLALQLGGGDPAGTGALRPLCRGRRLR